MKRTLRKLCGAAIAAVMIFTSLPTAAANVGEGFADGDARKSGEEVYVKDGENNLAVSEGGDLPREETPESPYKLPAVPESGWYTKDVTVTAREGYLIALSEEGPFEKSVLFDDQGDHTRYVWLQNEKTGGVTDRIPLNIKIDTIRPDAARMKITFDESPEGNFVRKLGELLGFFNPSVTVTFTAPWEDTSGIDYFTWAYEREKGASSVNDKEASGRLSVKEENGEAKATLTLPEDRAAQYRGNISFTATDKAGNESFSKTEDYVFVVDTLSPVIEERIEGFTGTDGKEKPERYYFSGDVTYRFTVNEANFYPEDVKVSVNAAPVNPVWEETDAGECHTGYVTLSGEGDYTVSVDYKDKSDNAASCVSPVLTVDETKPKVAVRYFSDESEELSVGKKGGTGTYFSGGVFAKITVYEKHFSEENTRLSVRAEDVSGREITGSASLYEIDPAWSENGDEHGIKVIYPGDANYDFKVTCEDMSGNAADVYESDEFTVDKTAPDELGVSYEKSVLDTVLHFISFGFYKAKTRVTLGAYDKVSRVESFTYWIFDTENSGSIGEDLNGNTLNGSGESPNGKTVLSEDITYKENGALAEAVVTLPEEDAAGGQFDGSVGFAATDRAGNVSEIHRESKRIIVDTVAPTVTASYGKPVREEAGRLFFDAAAEVTFTVKEKNFYSEDMRVGVSRDNGDFEAALLTWDGALGGGEGHANEDTHVGKLRLDKDGDYVITVSYADKSSNKARDYTSPVITVDTAIEEPVIYINGVKAGGGSAGGGISSGAEREKPIAARSEAASGTAENARAESIAGSYKNDVKVEFSYGDPNLTSVEARFIRTGFEREEDVTDAFIGTLPGGESFSKAFDISAAAENDGIYTLTFGIADKTRHSASRTVKFTVNRYGSVYEYGKSLSDLIKGGGRFVRSVDEDLVITEYNADRLTEGLTQILITRDGEMTRADYDTKERTVGISDASYSEYIYTLKAANFKEDGVYKISVNSSYATSDAGEVNSAAMPDNSFDDEGRRIADVLSFTVDSKKPKIAYIDGLERGIVNAGKLDVSYTISDEGGLSKIEILLNGETAEEITDFGNDLYRYSGKFKLLEAAAAQTVRIRATDRAGNVIDTADRDFNPEGQYVFNEKVTLSTNFFTRFWANKPLVAASAAVAAAVGIFVVLFIRKVKKKKSRAGETRP